MSDAGSPSGGESGVGQHAGGAAGASACEAWAARVDAKIAEVQACNSAEDCRQGITGLDYPGARCGLLVRTGAETGDLRALVEAMPSECGAPRETTCPYTDGVLCEAGRCTYRYVDEPVCQPVKLSRFCVRGTPQANGESLAVGDALRVQVFPEGCRSSSATFVGNAECTLESAGEDFSATGEICLGSVSAPGGGYTSDCAGGRFAECALDAALTAGEHTVTLDGQSIAFQVPSTLELGGACVGKQF
ncbi:MAG TPA: hypothetical protein VHP33_04465 [Polyangiaceae bacterium]|nr:hypothetical protein [Polyangiaceae bacterium]